MLFYQRVRKMSGNINAVTFVHKSESEWFLLEFRENLFIWGFSRHTRGLKDTHNRGTGGGNLTVSPAY